jgi:hypothetical protein
MKIPGWKWWAFVFATAVVALGAKLAVTSFAGREWGMFASALVIVSSVIPLARWREVQKD